MFQTRSTLTRRYARAIHAIARYSRRVGPETENRYQLYVLVCNRLFDRLYADQQKGGQ